MASAKLNETMVRPDDFAMGRRKSPLVWRTPIVSRRMLLAASTRTQGRLSDKGRLPDSMDIGHHAEKRRSMAADRWPRKRQVRDAKPANCAMTRFCLTIPTA
jgi:hypothetical protein